jgi:PIN domain nuclease of toxin-antitoxin system
VKLLIDTHAILWWLLDDPRLSRKALKALEDPDGRHWVSYVSLWEIAIKTGLGKLDTGGKNIESFARELDKQGFELLPIKVEHLSRLGELEHLHGDPFDRMLIAQALELDIPVLTGDKKIQQYPVKTIW